MSYEAVFVAILLVVSWLALLIADTVTAGLWSLLAGGSFKRIWLCGLWSLLLPVLLLAYGSLLERNVFRVKQVTLSFDQLPAAFDGYRMVQVSDLHARSFMHRTRAMRRAVDKVNGLQADLIVFTGDLVTLTPDELEPIAGDLSRLHAPDGVLSILGNHDYCTYRRPSEERTTGGLRELIAAERSLGWTMLLNENRLISRAGDTLAVIGVENISGSRHFPSTGDLAKAQSGTDGFFRILLSHDPSHWDREAREKGIPLMLSGHTHSAQFSLFGLSPSRLLFKQYRGLYEQQGQYLYVNVGLGETIFPARIGATPEITLITLKKK
ncbi:MAG: metallophosphoesterase [Bacteroidales bacterium]|nr:metallophosphoesterase [Bacteroidales bacterium]